MPFPVSPTINTIHTESDTAYVWSGTSWDFPENQLLVTSVSNPTSSDAGDVGTIWLNTATGAAWQMEGAMSGEAIYSGSASNIISVPLTLGTSVVSQTGNTTYRFSFDLTSYTRITAMETYFSLGSVGGPAMNGTATITIKEGEDTTSANNTAIGSLVLGAQVAQSDAKSLAGLSTPGVGFWCPFTFTDNNSLQPGRYTAVVSVVTTRSFSARSTSGNVIGGTFGNSAVGDGIFRLNGKLGVATSWVRIRKDTTVQVSSVQPTTQSDGSTLIEGDLWLDTSLGASGVLFYYDGGGWQPTKTHYDNTLRGVLASSDQQSALDELDELIDRLERGIQFVGSYNPSTNYANFTTASGLTDGVLPAASSVVDGYLISIGTGVGSGNAPGGTYEKGDFLISDGTVWSKASVGLPETMFIRLSDVPNVYTSSGGKFLTVNSAETAITFSTFVETHSIRSGSEPVVRTNGNPLQSSDQWHDTATGREKVHDGAAWNEQSYVEMTSGTVPTTTRSGALWYDTSTSTLYVYDTTAAKWVAV